MSEQASTPPADDSAERNTRNYSVVELADAILDSLGKKAVLETHQTMYATWSIPDKHQKVVLEKTWRDDTGTIEEYRLKLFKWNTADPFSCMRYRPSAAEFAFCDSGWEPYKSSMKYTDKESYFRAPLLAAGVDPSGDKLPAIEVDNRFWELACIYVAMLKGVREGIGSLDQAPITYASPIPWMEAEVALKPFQEKFGLVISQIPQVLKLGREILPADEAISNTPQHKLFRSA